jgi:hypothetical protein
VQVSTRLMSQMGLGRVKTRRKTLMRRDIRMVLWQGVRAHVERRHEIVGPPTVLTTRLGPRPPPFFPCQRWPGTCGRVARVIEASRHLCSDFIDAAPAHEDVVGRAHRDIEGGLKGRGRLAMALGPPEMRAGLNAKTERKGPIAASPARGRPRSS